MSILLGITAAIIGALFWAGRRRYYSGPVVINNDTDVYCDGDGSSDDCADNAEAFCSSDDGRDDDSYSSGDYSDSSSASDSRDD